MKTLRRLILANVAVLFAFGIGIALMALFEQLAFGAGPAGWPWSLGPLALAAALAWLARRPSHPAETAAEIAALQIPAEIRQSLLQQIGEAAAQEERNRLARDLHDSIKQQLFSINVGAAAAQERWDHDPEGARKALADVRRSAREAMVEMQAMLHQLRPEALGTAGLIEALREQCEALGYRTGAEVALEIGEPVPDDRMPPGAQNTLFRIGQEMLANVARHARARHVRLWLGRQGEEVMLRIVDDGQGFDPAAVVSGMGLRHLKERAETLRGRIEIASSPAAGTRVEVHSPLLPAPAAVEPAQLMRTGFRDCVVWAIGWALVFLLFKVPLIRVLMDNVAEAHPMTPFLFLGGMGLLAWWSRRYAPRRARGDYAHRESRTLEFLSLGMMTIFLCDVGGTYPVPWYFWTISLVMFFVAAVGVIEIHQTSQVRRFWRKEARIWLWLVLLVETGVLGAAGLAAVDRLLVNLHPAEILLLLLGGATFAYIASRQPREEEAP